MHGRKRAEYKARLSDPKLSAALGKKAQQWNATSRELLQKRNSNSTEDSSTNLLLTSKLLRVNPDPSHLWNQRRELLGDAFDIQTELELTRACLERNPKAYGAWFHRKWSIREYLLQKNEESSTTTLLQEELQLCALLLQHDERNFHCWNYRRFVVSAMAGNSDGSWNCSLQNDTMEQIMGPQLAAATLSSNSLVTISPALLEQEWDFCGEKIHQNFSNCSAFHYRSKLLPLMNHSNKIKEELDLVQNAIFTEPDDQTAWWYHRFVLEYASQQDGYEELLQEQAELLRELVETENGQCKWGLLALVDILEQLKQEEERRSCLEQLIQLDSDRAKRYESMMSSST